MGRPALTMVLLIFISLNAGCHRLRPSWCPWPGKNPAPKTNTGQSDGRASDQDKERIKTKVELTKKLDRANKKLLEMENLLADKRAEGFDVSGPEDNFQKSKNLLKEAENLYLEANLSGDYEIVIGLLQAIEDSFDTIKREAKKAPRFRDKTPSQPREFADDRDWVVENRGHPDPTNMRIGPYTNFTFDIWDPTQYLGGAIQWGCFDPNMNRFTLQMPPKIAIWEYHTGVEGTEQYVFVEENPNLQQFILKQSLKPEERDQALTNMCMSQGTGYENYKLIAAYKGKMAGSPEEYLRQLLSGQFRFADQFGIAAMVSAAKAAAVLPDLELVSIVFNKNIGPLIGEQAAALKKIHERLADYESQAVFDSNKGVLIFDQTAENQVKKAFSKILSWQSTLSPRKKDKAELLKFTSNDPEISVSLDAFEEAIRVLAKEIHSLTKELLRFRREYPELVFYDDEKPILVMLLKGVGFRVDPRSQNTLFKNDVPQLMVESELYYIRHKYDENPPVVLKSQFEVTEANKLIDVSKEYQRLTSFIVGWPSGKPLSVGNYKIVFKITDKVREKTVSQEVNFLVISASLRPAPKD
ncbi:MAG: hypothetical protein WED06_01025 [Candidatus Paceibacterota bacterium]